MPLPGMRSCVYACGYCRRTTEASATGRRMSGMEIQAMSRILTSIVLMLSVVFAGFAVAQNMPDAKKSELKPSPGLKELRLGLIAKSQSNPVFQAAKVGAE